MPTPILDLDLPPEHPLRQILDTISAHPDVREPLMRALLTEDFLALPAQIQDLSERVDGLTDQVGELRSDFHDFRDETRGQFGIVNARIDETNTRIDETNHSMQEQFQQVNQRIDDSADSVVRRMEGSLGRFRGETYEKRCADIIDELLMDYFAYAQPLDREPINYQLAQFRHDGLISRQEYIDGRNADIIAHDAFADGEEQRWAVVEVSITFNRNDLENAARRAAVIANVFGVRTQAFVVTNSPWPDDVNAIAEQLNVNIVRNYDPAYVAEPI